MEAMADSQKLSMEQSTGMTMGKQLSAEQAFMAMDISRKAIQVREHGMDTMWRAEKGSAEFGLQQKLGQGDAFMASDNAYGKGIRGATAVKAGTDIGMGNAYGGSISKAMDVSKMKSEIDIAGTKGRREGIGDLNKLETAEATKAKYEVDYTTPAVAKEMETLTPEAFVNFRQSQLGERQGALEGMISSGRSMGLQGDDYRVSRQMADFVSRGKTLDSDMASSINNQFFGGKDVAKSGMRADFGVGKDGDLQYLTLSSQTAAKGVDIKDGKATEHYISQGGYDVTRTRTTDGETIRVAGVKGERFEKEKIDTTRIDSTTKVESGYFKQIYDNYTNKVGGKHTVTYNDFKETYSGLKDMGYNVRIMEDASTREGYKVMIQDPKTHAVVAGDIKNVVTAYKQTADGATQEVRLTSGETLYSDSKMGELRNQFQNRLNVQMGVGVEGTVTEGVRDIAGETAAVAAGGVIDGVKTAGNSIAKSGKSISK